MTDQLSRVFAALADPTRRDMVARLTVGDATVSELAAPYDMSLQAVSKHLKVLEEAGLVSRSREAQRRPVHLEAEVFDLMTKWIERYRRQAEERFRRLDAVLAAMQRQDDTHTEPRKEPHHDHHAGPPLHRGHHRGRPERAGHPHLTRDFAATPEQLFRAHTDPELFAQWIGPARSTTRIDHWDARTGGSCRYVAERDGEEYAFRGCFHEVRRGPHRADVHLGGHARRRGAGDAALRGPRQRPHPAARVQSLCDCFEGRDAWLASGMEVGVNEGYAKLDGMLADGTV